MSIEDIVLDRDTRGISELRPHVPADFCGRAAGLILDNPGTAVITTGFYILTAGASETDGPPGAIAIGDALQALDYEVVYVTDQYTVPIISDVVGSRARVVDFPVTDDDASKVFSDALLKELNPSVLIAIERCGLSDDGLYRNMGGRDITAYTARVDHMFTDHPASVGVGDGGNEIGMGSLASVITTVPTLVKHPCQTKTTELVLASVSNWGGYGLVAALSEKKGRNLLPSVEYEQEILQRNVRLGAVDGMSAKSEFKVDGFTMEENSQMVERLHRYLVEQGLGA